MQSPCEDPMTRTTFRRSPRKYIRRPDPRSLPAKDEHHRFRSSTSNIQQAIPGQTYLDLFKIIYVCSTSGNHTVNNGSEVCQGSALGLHQPHRAGGCYWGEEVLYEIYCRILTESTGWWPGWKAYRRTARKDRQAYRHSHHPSGQQDSIA